MQFHSSPRNRARGLPDKGLPIGRKGYSPRNEGRARSYPCSLQHYRHPSVQAGAAAMGTALGATTPNAAPLGVQARAPSATCAAPPRSRPEDCPGKGLPIPPPCKPREQNNPHRIPFDAP